MSKVFAVTFIILILLLGWVGIKNYLDFYSTSKRVDNIPSATIGTANPQASDKDIPLKSVAATGLEVPWALAFLPDGSLLVTERKGSVRIIDKNGNLLSSPVAEINVRNVGESGLHGIAVHPKFPQTPYIYLYYTYSSENENSLNKVSRFTLSENKLKDEQVIVDKIPGATIHDGGRIKFGPDGFLYITTGDASNPSFSQNKDSLAGKVLRVTDEGQNAPGNSFNSPVYSYGHRNPQGIAWDKDGKLWEVEHGQSATDELNLVEAGKNYGWPTIRGDQKRDGMVSPVLHSGSDTWAPAGAAYFNNSIFFGGLRGQTLFQAVIDGSNATLKTHFKGEFGRIRDVVLGPDNMLYITTSNRDGRGSPASDDDKIIRINPDKL